MEALCSDQNIAGVEDNSDQLTDEGHFHPINSDKRRTQDKHETSNNVLNNFCVNDVEDFNVYKFICLYHKSVDGLGFPMLPGPLVVDWMHKLACKHPFDYSYINLQKIIKCLTLMEARTRFLKLKTFDVKICSLDGPIECGHIIIDDVVSLEDELGLTYNASHVLMKATLSFCRERAGCELMEPWVTLGLLEESTPPYIYQSSMRSVTRRLTNKTHTIIFPWRHQKGGQWHLLILTLHHDLNDSHAHIQLQTYDPDDAGALVGKHDSVNKIVKALVEDPRSPWNGATLPSEIKVIKDEPTVAAAPSLRRCLWLINKLADGDELESTGYHIFLDQLCKCIVRAALDGLGSLDKQLLFFRDFFDVSVDINSV